MAAGYDLKQDELSYILRDCDHPADRLKEQAYCRALDLKGFWRVDKDNDPELRHTVLTLVAFHDLQYMIRARGGDREKGITAFCNQNDGEGWMLPETLCLADLGLGHDDRAKRPQPVRTRLGERFLPWQHEQSAEDSWKECEMHARNLLGEAGFARLQAQLRGETAEDDAPAVVGGRCTVDGEQTTEFRLMPDTGKMIKAGGHKKKDARGQGHMF
ncbi:MAG: hypothetical protein ABSE73_13385 [Planctomycetota bacterium]